MKNYKLTYKKHDGISHHDYAVISHFGKLVTGEVYQIGAKNAYIEKVKYIDFKGNKKECEIGVSYNTPVVLKVDGKIYDTPHWYSRTTTRHITAIHAVFGGYPEKGENNFFKGLEW